MDLMGGYKLTILLKEETLLLKLHLLQYKRRPTHGWNGAKHEKYDLWNKFEQPGHNWSNGNRA
jgi:hypothetical protein